MLLRDIESHQAWLNRSGSLADSDQKAGPIFLQK
jgi:hypothetical protein